MASGSPMRNGPSFQYTYTESGGGGGRFSRGSNHHGTPVPAWGMHGCK